jgi:hypothetical protein
MLGMMASVSWSLADEEDSTPPGPIPVVHGVKSLPDALPNTKKKFNRMAARRPAPRTEANGLLKPGPDLAVRQASHFDQAEHVTSEQGINGAWNNLPPANDSASFEPSGECGCDSCGSCCGGGWYADTEYLLWWLNDDTVPALVTTSTQGTTRANAGVLGLNSASILFGGGTVDTNARSGGRVVLGYHLDECNRIEGDWFDISKGTANFNQASTGSPILARPFFNLGTGAQDSNVVAFPAQLSGSIQVSDVSRFQGAGFRMLHFLASDCGRFGQSRISSLVGFRYLHLGENLDVQSSSTVTATDTAIATGTVFGVTDSFHTNNDFYGAQVGLQRENYGCCWKLVTTTKLNLGAVNERVVIAGSSTTTPPNGTPTTTAGGLLAQPTNIGTYRQTEFAVVPELQLKLVRDVCRQVQFTIGYDVLYMSRVARPGEQIDTRINTSQSGGGTLTGTPGPLFAFHESDLWVQGLSVGLEWRR